MMNLNYIAFFLISFIPLIIAAIWYNPKSPIVNWAGIEGLSGLKWWHGLLAFGLSFTLVYGYINLVIHQMGFYELFFTDIMQGKAESQQVVDEFLAKYRYKHRHFGHGVFHGVINAFVFGIPFVGFHALVEKKSMRYVWAHLGYWLITSILISAFISEFV